MIVKSMSSAQVDNVLLLVERGHPESAGLLRTYIAAVEADRDEAREEIDRWKENCGLVGGEGDPARVTPEHLAADLQKRDRDANALRERVSALEAEARGSHERRMEMAQQLSAMRQRAGQLLGAGSGAEMDAARYIVGEEAPESTPTPTDDPCGECGANTWHPSCPPAPESTTAEAFATVRNVVTGVIIAADRAERETAALSALALLELRMGALARELARVLAAWKAHEVSGSPSLFYDVERTLTDAPPVFTLNEVEGAAFRVLDPSRQDQDAKHWAAGIVDELKALRR